MEVLAGEDRLETEVVIHFEVALVFLMQQYSNILLQKESGCTFRFNFATVYWNSRLQAEHDRLIQIFRPQDTICMR
jgi:tRNA G37 N-methylase Trm5